MRSVVICTADKCHQDHRIKDVEIGWACMEGEENCRQDFGGAAWKKDILWKTMAYRGENIKIERGLDIVDRPTSCGFL